MRLSRASILMVFFPILINADINPTIGFAAGLNYDIITAQETAATQQGLAWHGGFEAGIQPVERLQFGAGIFYMATTYDYRMDSSGIVIECNKSYNNIFIPVNCAFQITHMTMLTPYFKIGGAMMRQLGGMMKIGSNQNTMPMNELRSHLYIIGGGGFIMTVTPNFSVKPEIIGQVCLNADREETNSHEEAYDIFFRLGFIFDL